MTRRILISILSVLFLAPAVRAQSAIDKALAVRLAEIFTDNMVLQHGLPVPIWGIAPPRRKITVSFAGQKKEATADDHGKWSVKLDPLKSGGPFPLTVSGETSLKLSNVLVGEVWVCSGQSNMEWPMHLTDNAENAISAAVHPRIRLFTVSRRPSEQPVSDLSGKWEECSPSTVRNFSAVAYYFGKELEKNLDVPIGLIHTSWGGTPIQAWTRNEVLTSDPDMRGGIDWYTKRLAEYQKEEAAYKEALEKHKAAAEEARKKNETEPKPPEAPRHPGLAPSSLYNGMVAPLIPYAIAGAIWYQGESNAGDALGYRKLMPAMIKNWRDEWKQGEFPFLIVQLANFMKREDTPTDPDWAWLREAQLMTLDKSPRTAMAVAIDIGAADDIHPRNKQDVGKRLALGALKVACGKDIVYSGPVYDSMKIDGDKVRLRFKHTGAGLETKSDQLRGFSIAGEDRRFHWAEAKIENAEVVVWSQQVPNPLAVRYAWASNPEATLYNKEGLPASPFRTDDWPRSK